MAARFNIDQAGEGFLDPLPPMTQGAVIAHVNEAIAGHDQESSIYTGLPAGALEAGIGIAQHPLWGAPLLDPPLNGTERRWLGRRTSRREWPAGVTMGLDMDGVALCQLRDLLTTDELRVTRRWYVRGIVMGETVGEDDTITHTRVVWTYLDDFCESARGANMGYGTAFYKIAGRIYLTPHDIPKVSSSSAPRRRARRARGFAEILTAEQELVYAETGDVVGWVPNGSANCVVQAIAHGLEYHGQDGRAQELARVLNERDYLARKRYKKWGAGVETIRYLNTKVLSPAGYTAVLAKYVDRPGRHEWRYTESLGAVRRLAREGRLILLGFIDYDGHPYRQGDTLGDQGRPSTRHCVWLSELMLRPDLAHERLTAERYYSILDALCTDYMQRAKTTSPSLEYMVGYHREMASVKEDTERQRRVIEWPRRDQQAVELAYSRPKRPIAELVFDIEAYQESEWTGPPRIQWTADEAQEVMRLIGATHMQEVESCHVPCMVASTCVSPYVTHAEEIGEPAVQHFEGEGCIDAWLRYLDETYAGHRVVCYAHNAKKYDAYVVLSYARCFPVKSMLRTGAGILALRYKGDHDTTIEIRCTLCHIASSLSAACKSYGVPEEYRKKDFDCTNITKDNWRALSYEGLSLKEYLRFDVISLAHLFVKLHNSYLRLWGPGFRCSGYSAVLPFLTSPSVSMRLLYWRYLSTPLETILLHPLRQLIQLSMRGGMVMPFYRNFEARSEEEWLEPMDANSVS